MVQGRCRSIERVLQNWIGLMVYLRNRGSVRKFAGFEGIAYRCKGGLLGEGRSAGRSYGWLRRMSERRRPCRDACKASCSRASGVHGSGRPASTVRRKIAAVVVPERGCYDRGVQGRAESTCAKAMTSRATKGRRWGVVLLVIKVYQEVRRWETRGQSAHLES